MSKWNLSGNDSTVFELDSNDSSVQRIQYNDQQGNDFRATYAYDDPASYPMMPVCSDLMVQYYPEMQADSAAGVQISKYGIAYQGWIKPNGAMQMFRLTSGGQQVLLEETDCLPSDLDKTSRFRFAVVDQQLVLEFGSSKLVSVIWEPVSMRREPIGK